MLPTLCILEGKFGSRGSRRIARDGKPRLGFSAKPGAYDCSVRVVLDAIEAPKHLVVVVDAPHWQPCAWYILSLH